MNTHFQRVLLMFFLIADLVHVIGLVKPFSEESVTSHVLHLLGYTTCGWAVYQRNIFSPWLYLAGFIYPFIVHFQCMLQLNKNFAICFITVLFLLSGVIFVYKSKQHS